MITQEDELPLVSIITPSLNQGRFIRDTIIPHAPLGTDHVHESLLHAPQAPSPQFVGEGGGEGETFEATTETFTG